MSTITFAPYDSYRELVAQLDEFSSLTEYSYALAQQLLFKHPRDTVDLPTPESPGLKELSYGMGDQQVENVEMVCEWVSFEVYAERESLSSGQVEAAAEEGKLGPIRASDTGCRLLLWPPRYHAADESEWPKVGMKKFHVTTIVTARGICKARDLADMDSFDSVQQEYLRLAHALGEPAQVAERATELLNRSAFLLEWIAFEVFLRSTVHELVRRHPENLASGKPGRENLTVEEVMKLSAGLSDIGVLRDNLVNRVIERQEHGGESVHGLLNLLKSQFKFKSDPYEAWYVLRGQRRTASYNALIELKDTRNALVHDAGRVSPEFLKAHPAVPVRNGAIVINAEFHLNATLMLRSIAYSVAHTISAGDYTA
jgi:hypothetical protein